MNAVQILLGLLGSAAVGALVSSLFIALDHWRERRSRERELLFRAALEISKATAERAAKALEKFAPGLELAVIEKTYEILKEVYETGKMSKSNKTFLDSFLRRKNSDTTNERGSVPEE